MTTAIATTMRLSVLQEALNIALNDVGRAVGDRRNTLHITTHVLLEASGEWLTLRCTDLESYAIYQCPAKVEVEGAICLPWDKLREFVAALPNERIDLSLSESGRNVTLVCARRTARMAGIDASEFPPSRIAMPNAIEVSMPAAVLREGLRRVLKCAAADATRPVLEGVYMSFLGNTLAMATADSFRLAEQRLTLPDALPTERKALIPAVLMNEVYGLLGKDGGQVVIVLPPDGWAGGFFHFRAGRTDFACIQIEGMYPNYQRFIPKSTGEHLTLDCTELAQAVKTAAVLGNNTIRLIPHEGDVGMLEIAAGQETDDATCEIDAVFSGAPSKTAMNANQLLDALNALGPGKITMQADTPTSPVVFRKLNDADYLHVLMPMFPN